MLQRQLIISLGLFLIMTILTGIAYPLCVTGIARLFFREQANGSLILKDGQLRGSLLIGQKFDSVIYFTSRPSAISYHPLPSGASNLALSNRKLREQYLTYKRNFLFFNGLDSITEVPEEMLFASASGLDPHISPQAAYLQVKRIAGARKFSPMQEQQLSALISKLAEPPLFLFLGQERINLLLLNLETDNIK